MRNTGNETNDKMLTIENLKKIQNRSVAGNWMVKEVGELSHNDCYYFVVYQIKAGVGVVDTCKIFWNEMQLYNVHLHIPIQRLTFLYAIPNEQIPVVLWIG